MSLSKENIPSQDCCRQRIFLVDEGKGTRCRLSWERIRIAVNGDTANKIGTSSLAIVARHYGIPFYVAAPVSSFDSELESGRDIHIELRGEEEILYCQGVPMAPEGARALNPGFDITEHNLITALFCEKGMARPVARDTILKILT